MCDLFFQRWIASTSGRIQTSKSILGRSCKKKRFHVLLATPVSVKDPNKILVTDRHQHGKWETRIFYVGNSVPVLGTSETSRTLPVIRTMF